MAHSTFIYLTSNPTPKQCAMPVFKGLLLPKHDELVQTLLFRLAKWQALATLRLHTEDTLALLHQALQWLGAQTCKFQQVTCRAFYMKELPQIRLNDAGGRWLMCNLDNDGSHQPLKPYPRCSISTLTNFTLWETMKQ